MRCCAIGDRRGAEPGPSSGVRVRSLAIGMLAALVFTTPLNAAASDACSPFAIVTSARVQASDGKHYVMEAYYSAPEITALRQVDDDGALVIAAEGPRAWSNQDTGDADDDALRSMALGHQFHALLLHFDEIVPNARDSAVTYRGAERQGRIGTWPYGEGDVRLVYQRGGTRVEALILTFPERPEIVVTFAGWRSIGGQHVPFRATINDGQRTFSYAFTSVSLAPRTANWFFDALPAPDTEDAVLIYRSHRRTLAAHCAGDAAALAAEGGPIEINVSGQGVRTASNAAIESRFETVLGRLDYTAYHDEAWPIIEEDGELGWIAVTVRAVGEERGSGADFDDRWSWVALMRKIDGVWRRVGVSAVRRED